MLIHATTRGTTTFGTLDAHGNVVNRADLNWEVPVLTPAAFLEILEAIRKQKALMEQQAEEAKVQAEPNTEPAPIELEQVVS